MPCSPRCLPRAPSGPQPASWNTEDGPGEVSGASSSPQLPHPVHTRPFVPLLPAPRLSRSRADALVCARTHPRRAARPGRGSLRRSDRCGRREGARGSHACPAAQPSASERASSAGSWRVRPPRHPRPARPASGLGEAARPPPAPPHTDRAPPPLAARLRPEQGRAAQRARGLAASRSTQCSAWSPKHRGCLAASGRRAGGRAHWPQFFIGAPAGGATSSSSGPASLSHSKRAAKSKMRGYFLAVRLSPRLP
ncbi:uncharacterized protein [Macaca fascicularis]|uniref:uncharacterized protein n=1 Tax=Macaca fascicularis TaxID=9541 RepID=UPI003D154FA4